MSTDSADELSLLRAQLGDVESCLSRAGDGPFQRALDEERARLQAAISAEQQKRQGQKPLALRRSELEKALKEVEGKRTANATKLQEAKDAVLRLEGYVTSQQNRASQIRAELALLAEREAEALRSIAVLPEVSVLEQQLVDLQYKLAEARNAAAAAATAADASRSEKLGMALYDARAAPRQPCGVLAIRGPDTELHPGRAVDLIAEDPATGRRQRSASPSGRKKIFS